MYRAHAAIVLAAGLLVPLCAAAVVYVDDDAPAGGNGQSWPTAYKFLRDALTVAAADPNITEIRVAEGTYKPSAQTDPNDPRSATFTLLNGVGIYGGYGGLGAPDPGLRDPNAFVSILSGDLAGNDGPNFQNNDENSYHVVTAPSGTGATAVLDGVRVAAGNAGGGASCGGGLYCQGSPTLTNCTLSGNAAYGNGGGLCNDGGGGPTLTNCTFSGNSAGYGGGLYNNSGNPALTNCTFSANWADDYGGGLYNNFGSPALANCTFSANSALYDGAGLANWSGSPTLTNCTLSGNKTYGNGGGLCNEGGASPTLTNCTFSGNSAGCGGGLYNNSGSPTLTDCSFAGNGASSGGAGVYNKSGSPTLANCAFSANSASSGGGVYNKSGSPTLANCAFSANSASSGGGLYNSGSPTLTNCMFNGNSVTGPSAYGGGICNSPGNPTLTNCTFSGNSATATGAGYGTCQGAGVYNYGGNPTLTNCIFNGNSVTATYALTNAYGGGIYNGSGSPALTNCVFSWNSAVGISYAAYNSSGNPTLTNCTFTGNAGGLYNSSGNPTTLTNCILWGNTGADLSGRGFAVTYSDVQDGCPGTGNIVVDPCFLWSLSGVPRLGPGSPCIDAGNNLAVPGGVGTDAEGGARFRDDPGTADTGVPGGGGGSAIVDMGAYEFNPDCNGNGVPDSEDIAQGTSDDCNSNGLPDECDFAYGNTLDRDNNGIPDECDVPVLYVDGDAPPGGDGRSWPTAFRDLQDALAVVLPGQAIRVAQGTYRPSARTDPNDGRSATFQLKDRVRLFGGYAGLGAPDPDLRDPDAYVSILSGDLAGNDGPNFQNNADNSYHVVTTGGAVGPRAGLDGLTVTGGNANGSWWPASCGGGLYNAGGSPTLADCSLSGNASSTGAGLCNSSGSPTVTGCRFSGNLAHSGGGVSNGGGMYTQGGSPTLTSCTFSGNSGTGVWGSGGGLYNRDGNLMLINCSFSGNQATGVYLVGVGGGGLYSMGTGTATLVGCSFSGNWTNGPDGYGGGISNYSGNLTLTSCTFSGNWSRYGGGVFAGGSSTLRNCTLSGNSASQYGGGVACSYGGSAAIRDSIVWGNAAPDGAELALGEGGSPPTLSISFSDVEGGQGAVYKDPNCSVDPNCSLNWGLGNIDVDPRFVDPGGPDGDPNTWADGNYRLSPLSPCINRGDPAFVADPNETDLDGNPRVLFGRVDMGAYEATQFADCNSNGVEDARDILLGSSQDTNSNGVPDECERACAGDVNCDGRVTFADIDLFVAALAGESAWTHAPCPWLNADCNGDSHVTFADIDPFVARIGTTCP